MLICPDSLKGVLSAAGAAQAVAAGVTRAGLGLVPVRLPLSDGGDGLVDVIAIARGGRLRSVAVHDALGRPVSAGYLLLDDGCAVVESAQAIGLSLLAPDELDPLRASSRGFGELLAAVFADPGAASVLVGLGGVATVDGGTGLLEVLDQLPLPVRIASDVRNTLLGPRGAAPVFGPQKGAGPDDVPVLERRLAGLGYPDEIADHPGAGAAGGLGAALLHLGASMERGVDAVLELTGWPARAAEADLVVTGEGSVDLSSLEGKVPGSVVSATAGMGKPVVVFGGLVDPGAAQALLDLGATDVRALSGDKALAEHDLEALGFELAHLLPVIKESRHA